MALTAAYDDGFTLYTKVMVCRIAENKTVIFNVGDYYPDPDTENSQEGSI